MSRALDDFVDFCMEHGGTLKNHKEFRRLWAILAAEMPRWVPVAERMPNEIGDYLVWVDFTLDGIRSCYWDIATYGAGGWPDKATHWLDGVPSPPREEAK